MLIDSYERPYSTEASKSRAFVDRILALAGPDGGVVGAGDDAPGQRPLRDGGREAWDMIRRLHRKAWEKVGLNLQLSRTGHDQTQKKDVTSPANASNPVPLRTPWAPSATISPTMPPASFFPLPAQQSQLFESNRRFQNVARSRICSTPPPSAPPTAALSETRQPLPSSAGAPFMDSASLNPHPLLATTPPSSMVDPNLTFDWDEWDAVFGQSLPIADDFMDLDPAMGLAFTGFENTAPGSDDVNQGINGVEW